MLKSPTSLRATGYFPRPVNVCKPRVSGSGEELRDLQLTVTVSQAGACFHFLSPPAKHVWAVKGCSMLSLRNSKGVSLLLVSSLFWEIGLSRSHFGVWLLEMEWRGKPSCSGFGLDWGQTGHQLLIYIALWVSRLCKHNLYLLRSLPSLFLLYCKKWCFQVISSSANCIKPRSQKILSGNITELFWI